MRYELADYEWTAIRPMLPNKPRGVPRVNDRRVLNGIFWVLRSGAPWRYLPAAFDEDFIKKLCELLEISRTAAEESGFVVLICCQHPYFFYIPNMMCMPGFGFAAKAFGFLASRWVSLVGQFSITIYGYVTASAQLLAYRGFARAGDSLDKIISLAHCPFLGLISRRDSHRGF
jgi:Putative transposase of IS4/5 family (DUF4096)